MLTYRLRHSVALVLMVTQFVGCYRWVPTSTGIDALVQDSVRTVRLTLRDESRVPVLQPIIVGDTIKWSGHKTSAGTTVGVHGAAALEDVDVVEVWELDGGATGSAVGGFLVAGLLIGLLLLARPTESPPQTAVPPPCDILYGC